MRRESSHGALKVDHSGRRRRNRLNINQDCLYVVETIRCETTRSADAHPNAVAQEPDGPPVYQSLPLHGGNYGERGVDA
jgi:hypothetical protein